MTCELLPAVPRDTEVSRHLRPALELGRTACRPQSEHDVDGAHFWRAQVRRQRQKPGPRCSEFPTAPVAVCRIALLPTDDCPRDDPNADTATVTTKPMINKDMLHRRRSALNSAAISPR